MAVNFCQHIQHPRPLLRPLLFSQMTELQHILQAVISLDGKVDRLEQKVDGVEQKVDRLEPKVDRLEQKVDRMSQTLGMVVEDSARRQAETVYGRDL